MYHIAVSAAQSRDMPADGALFDSLEYRQQDEQGERWMELDFRLVRLEEGGDVYQPCILTSSMSILSHKITPHGGCPCGGCGGIMWIDGSFAIFGIFTCLLFDT